MLGHPTDFIKAQPKTNAIILKIWINSS